MQLHRTIARIYKHPGSFFPVALARHLIWNVGRVLGWYPGSQRFSRSRLLVAGYRSAVNTLVNAVDRYDFHNMALVEKTLAKGGLLFDVGANVGSYSILASENPAVKVVAFEPKSSTFRRLEENLKLNARQNVEAVCAAVGAGQGSLRVVETGESSTARVEAMAPGDTGGVSAYPLDHWEPQAAKIVAAGLPVVVKIDVEGFEPEVIRGAHRVLALTDLLLIETKFQEPEIAASLARAGLEGPFYWSAVTERLSRERPHDSVSEDFVFYRPGGVFDRGQAAKGKDR